MASRTILMSAAFFEPEKNGGQSTTSKPARRKLDRSPEKSSRCSPPRGSATDPAELR
jgi:hypothetical protein